MGGPWFAHRVHTVCNVWKWLITGYVHTYGDCYRTGPIFWCKEFILWHHGIKDYVKASQTRWVHKQLKAILVSVCLLGMYKNKNVTIFFFFFWGG